MLFNKKIHKLQKEIKDLYDIIRDKEKIIKAFEGGKKKRVFLVCLGSVNENIVIEILADEVQEYFTGFHETLGTTFVLNGRAIARFDNVLYWRVREDVKNE
jgi:hypothetical protein